MMIWFFFLLLEVECLQERSVMEGQWGGVGASNWVELEPALESTVCWAAKKNKQKPNKLKVVEVWVQETLLLAWSCVPFLFFFLKLGFIHLWGLCVCVCVSLLVLLCVCDAGHSCLTLADVADTRPLTVHRLLPQCHLQAGKWEKLNQQFLIFVLWSNWKTLHRWSFTMNGGLNTTQSCHRGGAALSLCNYCHRFLQGAKIQMHLQCCL